MRVGLLNLLRCPDCRQGYLEVYPHREHGYLQCACRNAIPMLAGFPLFTEARPRSELATPGVLEELASTLLGTRRQYEEYLRDKQSRDLIEAYAAFQPFNESGRALEPLMPHIRPAVRAGGAVLDTWCRTGWSGEWLAGQFPEQLIVSLWEGDSSVLGYRGFRRLMGSERRPGNLEIIFHHPGRPLPFADEAFDLVHAHDALHRFGIEPFASECVRVSRRSAAVVFAHVHLANSEPDPYFERGGTKIHGRDYRRWLDGLAARGTSQRGFVFSEASLFDGPTPAVLADDADTAHYNGLIAIVPQIASQDLPARAAPSSEAAQLRYIVNPMFRLNMGRRTAQISRTRFDGTVGHYLLRHPAYTARLPERPVPLDDLALLALHLAAAGADRQSILGTSSSPSSMGETLQSLSTVELLRPACVSMNAHVLQRVHANQHARLSEAIARDCFATVRELDQPLTDGGAGGSLTGRDIGEFARRLTRYLHSRGIAAGQWIEVCPLGQPLVWVAAIAAAAAAGVNVRVIRECSGMAPDTLRICADHQTATAGWIPLGLEGQPQSLLALLHAIPDSPGEHGQEYGPESGLESAEEPGREAAVRHLGLIELPRGDGWLRCPVPPLAAGCVALRGQREESLLLLGDTVDIDALLTVLISIVDGRPLQSV